MGWHVWTDYLPGSGYAFAEEVEGLTAEQERRLASGVELARPLPRPVVTKLSEGALADVIGTVWMGRILSGNLRSTLEGCTSARLQFVEVAVPEYPERDYFFLNLLETVDCFDRERSDYDVDHEYPDVIQRIRKLVLTPLPAGVPEVFNLAGLPGLILVNDAVSEELRTACPAPGEFVEISDYTRGLV
jgi:hypothetical protein